MPQRKLRVYCDADIDRPVEDALSDLKQVNCHSARRRRADTRDDLDHFRFAARHRRVLVTHDADYLNPSRYPIMETEGVIVIKRGQHQRDVMVAFLRFMEWAWRPANASGGRFRRWKVDLSTRGFHYWERVGGETQTDYINF